MAQAPQPPHKPAPHTPPPAAKPHPPLKDPAEGKPPAIGGGHLARTGEDPHVDDRDRRPGDPQPLGVSGLLIEDGERDPGTVAEEQRARSAEIEAMGVEAWKDAHDERGDEERAAHPTIAPSPQQVEHHVEGSKK